MSTAIPYARESWSPVTGCSKGCTYCWSRAIAHRFKRSFKPTFHADKLAVPLHWRKPRTVVVAFNGDLFDLHIRDEEIAAVFGVMAACPQHHFFVLTKNALRMESWFQWVTTPATVEPCVSDPLLICADAALGDNIRGPSREFVAVNQGSNARWPLANVWIGVSVTNQADADKRIPDLLRCPAAVRWVSAEPLLGPLDLSPWIEMQSACGRRHFMPGNIPDETPCPECGDKGNWITTWGDEQARKLESGERYEEGVLNDGPPLNWVAAGAMSGPHAQPCDLDWARSLRDQCATAGVPFVWKDPTGFPLLDGVRHDAIPKAA